MQAPLLKGSGLDRVQVRVWPAPGDELGVASDFDEVRAIQHHDEIGHADGAEAMRNKDGDASVRGRICRQTIAVALHGGGVAFEERVLRLSIERRGWLVEHQQQRVIPHETARQGKLLSLAEGHVYTGGPRGAELRFEARR